MLQNHRMLCVHQPQLVGDLPLAHSKQCERLTLGEFDICEARDLVDLCGQN